jgi:hypothetical protein
VAAPQAKFLGKNRIVSVSPCKSAVTVAASRCLASPGGNQDGRGEGFPARLHSGQDSRPTRALVRYAAASRGRKIYFAAGENPVLSVFVVASAFRPHQGRRKMKQSWHGCMIVGVVAFGSMVSPAVAQQQPKQQPTQQQRPAQQPVQQRPAQQPQTYVPAHPSAAGQLNTAAQGPAKAAPTFDGGRGTPSTPVHVQTSTTTANAVTIAAQQNAAELARRNTRANPATRLDNHPVPPPGSH